MTKLKEIFNSLSFKIWRMVMAVLLLFIICIILVNMTFLKDSEEDFIYQQLRASAEAKREIDAEDQFSYNDQDDKNGDISLTTTFINHFVLVKTENGYKVLADDHTTKSYFNQGGKSEVIEEITEQILEGIEVGRQVTEGKIRNEGSTDYYFVDYSRGEDSQMVFLTSIIHGNNYPIQYIIAVFIILIVSFIASQLLTRKIAKPIKELETFAQEVALHHWGVPTPFSDTTEIHRLAGALNQMRDTLKTTQERERQFLQASSHNLKTPVMVIKGYAQALIDGVNIDSKNSAAEVIRIEAECLERRIIQMLKLNTFGHALERDQRQDIIRIDRLIKSLVSKFKMVRPELNWVLDLQELEIIGNSDALLTAFENLVENQLRFAEKTISIKMKVEQNIQITLENDGPLFSVDDPMCLFDRYKKDKEGKFGLGLAIVKQVIEGHDGHVLAANKDNGVVFEVTFPIDLRATFSEDASELTSISQ